MSLLFDTKVEFLDTDAVGTIGNWHPQEPLFAVASFSQERGGSVTIFMDSGEPRHDVTQPIHPTSKCTALAWHPEKILLATGWENGDVYVWFDGHREFVQISGPHKAAITLLEFSEKGGRMVTADIMGLLTGWRCDGQYQFLTIFTHDLREVFKYITFRRTICSEAREEMFNLAKAAVAGDETALDTLTTWRPRTAARSVTHNADVKDNYCFFVGSQTGVLYYVNQAGSCSEIQTGQTAPITQMLWHPKKDAVICLMENLTVALYLVETTGILTELDRVKLIAKSTATISGMICWVNCSIAIIIGDLSLRIWDIEGNDNYLLNMDLPNDGHTETTSIVKSRNQGHTTNKEEYFTNVVYLEDNHSLCASTNFGKLYTWKRNNNRQITQVEDLWQLMNIFQIDSNNIKQCCTGLNSLTKPCILVLSVNNVYILREQPLIALYSRELWMIQENARTVLLQNSSGESFQLKTKICISVAALKMPNLCLSDGRQILIYLIERTMKGSISNQAVNLLQQFNAECFSLALSNQYLFCLNSLELSVYSIGGVMLHKIQTTSNEGTIIGMDLTSSSSSSSSSNNYLTIFTMNGYVRSFDVSRFDPKPLFPSKSAYDLFDNFGEIIQVKCNAIGTHLAFIIANRNFLPQPKIFCWEFDRNHLMEIVLETKLDNHPKEMKNLSKEMKNQSTSLPVALFWDTDEPQLLAIEMKSLQNPDNVNVGMDNNGLDLGTSIASQFEHNTQYIHTNVWIIFYSNENHLNVLERKSLDHNEQLLDLCLPNIITLNLNVIRQQPLRDFADITETDVDIRQRVLKFSMYVALGNMDMAYRSVQSLESKAVWLNLAKMCVTTGRLDVAKVCLGHLEKVRSVAAIRQAMIDDDLELEAKIAVLATELDMKDEAKSLYEKCHRYDLLNKHLRRSGQIDEAIRIAELKDRIHLKNIYYHKGQECRNNGDIAKALEYFEKTQDPVQNITEMLLENPVLLKRYMQNTTNREMLKWWGQYIESSGDMEAALAVYQKAEDWYSQVKILCYLGKIAKAEVIARQSGDRAACYHLARHFENVGKFLEAITFYTRSQTYGNAIRICKENDFQDELWTVACSARNHEKSMAAAYFEECGSSKRAVELYHRAGHLHKAMDLAFASEQPDILEIIANELTNTSDPELVKKCSDFFITIEQYQKAVQLLAKTNHLMSAIDLCSERGVPITDELAELLTPVKGELEEKERIYILSQLGELLQQQGDYHTATKKFTQAGDKVRAMKVLLKSGNTEKIIYFANISRQREVYIMAANYLQALDWHNDNNIMKNIVIFYSKGQAYDSLANFFAISAQIEIDEFHDYERALRSMHEAAKALEKFDGRSQQVLLNLQRAINEVKLILNTQNALREGDYRTVIEECRKLLARPETPPIRQRDILVMLIKAFAYSKQYNESAKILKELSVRDVSWSSSGLLDKALVQKIADECNLDFATIWKPLGKLSVQFDADNSDDGTDNENDNDNEIPEEVLAGNQ